MHTPFSAHSGSFNAMPRMSTALPLAQRISLFVQNLRDEGIQVMLQGLLTGAGAAGLICVFRLACDMAGQRILPLLPSLDGWAWPAAACVAGGLLLLGLAGVWITHRYPMLAGSGIPAVDIALANNTPLPWKHIVFGKFAATWISITGGLAVGREGPCIHMGAAVGSALRRFWPQNAHSMARLHVAGSVAGLTAAFGAPLGGLLFAFEEMKTAPKAAMLLCTLLSAVAAGGVTHYAFGFGRVFPFTDTPPLAWAQLWLAVPLGLVTGLLGHIFNQTLITTVNGLDRWATVVQPDGTPTRPWGRACLRGLLPFACAGGLLYVYPQALDLTGPTPMALGAGTWTLAALCLLFTIKIVFAVTSFSSGMSGGLLTPILLMGSLAGACLAAIAAEAGQLALPQTSTVLVVGMAGFFAASVRAPLTGVALVTEMSGAWECLPELLVAAGIAAFIANRLGSLPVYDSLRLRAQRDHALAAQRQASAAAHKAGAPVPRGSRHEKGRSHRRTQGRTQERTQK